MNIDFRYIVDVEVKIQLIINDISRTFCCTLIGVTMGKFLISCVLRFEMFLHKLLHYRPSSAGDAVKMNVKRTLICLMSAQNFFNHFNISYFNCIFVNLCYNFQVLHFSLFSASLQMAEKGKKT